MKPQPSASDLALVWETLAKRRQKPRGLEVSVPFLCGVLNLPLPVPEFRFHSERRWRFDWAWVEARVALEVDGGVYTSGRHTRGAGYERDCEKLAEAALLGWTVFRASTGQVADGTAMSWIERFFRGTLNGTAERVETPDSASPHQPLGGGQRG